MELEDIIALLLQDHELDELLDYLGVTRTEALVCLVENGLVDEQDFPPKPVA